MNEAGASACFSCHSASSGEKAFSKFARIVRFFIGGGLRESMQRVARGFLCCFQFLRPKFEQSRVFGAGVGDGRRLGIDEQLTRGHQKFRHAREGRLDGLRFRFHHGGPCFGARLIELFRDLAFGFHRLEAGLPIATADEEALEAVVIALRDGVEFVIVAACATDGEAEEGFCP